MRLSAGRSFAVVGAGRCPMAVPWGRSQSVALLYLCAVRSLPAAALACLATQPLTLVVSSGMSRWWALGGFAGGLQRILAKLQVADRAQAFVRATDAGLGHQSRTRQDVRPTSYPILPPTAGTTAS